MFYNFDALEWRNHMPDEDTLVKDQKEQIQSEEQEENAGSFFHDAEKRAEREDKKENAKVDYEAAGQFMSEQYDNLDAIEAKRAERKAKKDNAKVDYAAAGKFMADEDKRRERADKKAESKNEPIELGDFFATDEEKLIRNYVDGKNNHIKELQEKAKTQKAAVAKASKGKKKKIQDIEERDKHIQEREATLKKQETEIEKVRFEIESIKKSKEGLVSSREKKEVTETEQGEKKEEDAKNIDKQIAKCDEQLKQKEEELQKLEQLHKEDSVGWDDYKAEQEERKKEKWYQKYLEEKNKLDSINGEITSDQEAIASAQDESSNRFKFKLVGESGNAHTIMLDSMTGEGTTLEEKTSEDEVVEEESKVESALKNAPVFKDLNKDEIPKYMSYNPKTGEMSGDKKDDGKANQAEKQKQQSSDESATQDNTANSEEEKKMVDKILSHNTTASVDEMLKPMVGFEPIKTLVNDIDKNGMEKAHKTVIDIMEKVRDAKTTQNSQAAQIMTMIMTSLEVLLDGEKDDNALVGLQAAMGEKLESKVKKQTLYTVILNGLSLYNADTKKEKKKFELSQDKSNIQNATDYISANKENVKDAMQVVSKSIDTHKLLGEAKAFKGKNDQFARMLEGAYRKQVGDTTASGINTGLNIAKSAIDTFAGLGDGMISKVINGAISGIGMLTNKVASAIAQKRDESQVLNAPDVLGNVKYDEKKVPEHKFNEILKRVSGITSKDGLYNVIKVTDAVTLHSNMKANKADPMVVRVMADLGYRDAAQFDKVKVTDILAKTGHPTGDWRGELRKSMVDNGKTQKKTFGQKVKGLAKKAWKGVKGFFGLGKQVEAD